MERVTAFISEHPLETFVVLIFLMLEAVGTVVWFYWKRKISGTSHAEELSRVEKQLDIAVKAKAAGMDPADPNLLRDIFPRVDFKKGDSNEVLVYGQFALLAGDSAYYAGIVKNLAPDENLRNVAGLDVEVARVVFHSSVARFMSFPEKERTGFSGNEKIGVYMKSIPRPDDPEFAAELKNLEESEG